MASDVSIRRFYFFEPYYVINLGHGAEFVYLCKIFCKINNII